MKLKSSEKQVQNAIHDYLSARKIIHWRQNSGSVVDEYEYKQGEKKGLKEKRFFKFMSWLFPRQDELVFLDIGGILPNGQYFTVEVKATGKEPSNNQQYTIDFINNETKAIALWADSIDSFVEIFEKFVDK